MCSSVHEALCWVYVACMWYFAGVSKRVTCTNSNGLENCHQEFPSSGLTRAWALNVSLILILITGDGKSENGVCVSPLLFSHDMLPRPLRQPRNVSGILR